MGVVIEICIKYPGGPNRIKGADIYSVTLIQVAPPGYFVYISITTPIVSALKNYYR
jgi:hypothetical protein